MSSTNASPTSPPSQQQSISELPYEDEKNNSQLEEAPDGGARAWLVAAGGSTIFFCCLGFSNSFGAFEEYYLTHQLHDRSPSEIAWIGSLSAFLQFAAGSIGGPLFDRYGAWVIRPAAIAYIIAMMLLSICTAYWHFLLVQGILMGLVMGFLQFPAFGAVAHYFDKKRAAAFGIVVSGSSIGGVILPIAISKMLNSSSLGFAWTVRIVGFIMIPLLGFSCVTIRARLPPQKTTFFYVSAFKDPKYALLITALFFAFLGLFSPLFYLPTYAHSRGMSSTLAGYLLAILNAASTFGRIIPGVLADKLGRLNVFAAGALSTGIVIFCMSSASTNAALIVYAVVIGFTSGTIISGASAAFSICTKDVNKFGTYLGMGMAVASLAALVGPPVNGALVQRFGGFFEVSVLSGTMCLVGGVVAFGTKALTREGVWGRV